MKTMKELVDEYNALAEKPVKKFKNLKEAERRLAELKANNVPKEPAEPSQEPKVVSAPGPVAKVIQKKISPVGAVSAMSVLWREKTANPELTRKEYITFCVERGIKSSTAGAQFHYVREWAKLEKDLAGRL